MYSSSFGSLDIEFIQKLVIMGSALMALLGGNGCIKKASRGMHKFLRNIVNKTTQAKVDMRRGSTEGEDLCARVQGGVPFSVLAY